MIIDMVLQALVMLLIFICALISTFIAIPASIFAGAGAFFGSMWGWNWIFPVDTLVVVYGIVIAVAWAEIMFYFSYQAYNFVFSLRN